MSKVGRGNAFSPDVPIISIASVANIVEGQLLSVNITRNTSNYISSCMVYTVANSAGTADFTAQNGILVTFALGEVIKNITVPILSDLLSELDETFLLKIASPNNATIGNNQCVVTIVGTLTAVSVIEVSSPIAQEGQPLIFNVTLSSTTPQVQSFPVTFTGSMFTNGGPLDVLFPFTFSSGVTEINGGVSVPAGVSRFTISVATVADSVLETSETMVLSVGGISGTGTLSDFSTPTNVLSVSSPTVLEGATIAFLVTLNRASTGQSFGFTLGGTATGGTDYGLPLVLNNGATVSGTNFVVPSGITTFTVSTITANDTAAEASETVVLTVNGVTGTAIINNVNAANVQTILTATDGSTTTYTIELDKPSVAGQLFTPVLTGA